MIFHDPYQDVGNNILMGDELKQFMSGIFLYWFQYLNDRMTTYRFYYFL